MPDGLSIISQRRQTPKKIRLIWAACCWGIHLFIIPSSKIMNNGPPALRSSF